MEIKLKAPKNIIIGGGIMLSLLTIINLYFFRLGLEGGKWFTITVSSIGIYIGIMGLRGTIKMLKEFEEG